MFSVNDSHGLSRNAGVTISGMAKTRITQPVSHSQTGAIHALWPFMLCDCQRLIFNFNIWNSFVQAKTTKSTSEPFQKPRGSNCGFFPSGKTSHTPVRKVKRRPFGGSFGFWPEFIGACKVSLRGQQCLACFALSFLCSSGSSKNRIWKYGISECSVGFAVSEKSFGKNKMNKL